MKARFDGGPYNHATIDVPELAETLTMGFGPRGPVVYVLVRVQDGVGYYTAA
jgi:hypothetical protein